MILWAAQSGNQRKFITQLKKVLLYFLLLCRKLHNKGQFHGFLQTNSLDPVEKCSIAARILFLKYSVFHLSSVSFSHLNANCMEHPNEKRILLSQTWKDSDQCPPNNNFFCLFFKHRFTWFNFYRHFHSFVQSSKKRKSKQ